MKGEKNWGNFCEQKFPQTPSKNFDWENSQVQTQLDS